MDWLHALKNFDRQYKTHALQRMLERNISFQDIKKALQKADIIEEYPEDKPLPSCLILGFTLDEKPIHLVMGVDKTARSVYIITVYRPNAKKWTKDFKTRK